MRFASFEHKGRRSFGIAEGDSLIDVCERDSSLDDLVSALRSDEGVQAVTLYENNEPDYEVAEVTFLPVISKPGKLTGVALNYRDRAAELRANIPERPALFVRFADSLVGHLDRHSRMTGIKASDWEISACATRLTAGRGEKDARYGPRRPAASPRVSIWWRSRRTSPVFGVSAFGTDGGD